MEEDKYSPYCKDCGSCGETGCCSPLSCARVRMTGCDYGEANFNDIVCEVMAFKEIYEHIMNKEGLTILISDLKEEVEAIYDKHEDEKYGG